MPALEEDARSCVQNERASRFDGRTEFGESEGRGRRELERRRGDKGCKLGVKPLLRRLVDERERAVRKAVYGESGCEGPECERRENYEIEQN